MAGTEFGQWLDSLPDGWPASMDLHGLMVATWNASRDVSTAYLREEVGELTAEVARLKAEIDSMHATYKTVHVTALNLQMAMVICRDEEPGTVIRETDGQRRDYVLGEDRQWTAR